MPNTIVSFQANYIDDDGKPTKKRFHLVIKVDEKSQELVLLKITSKWKNYFLQAKLGLVECLLKPSFVILNRIIVFDLTTLKTDDYSHKFRICQLHEISSCLETPRFTKIVYKLEKFWKNKLNRDKRIIRLKSDNLKTLTD